MGAVSEDIHAYTAYPKAKSSPSSRTDCCTKGSRGNTPDRARGSCLWFPGFPVDEAFRLDGIRLETFPYIPSQRRCAPVYRRALGCGAVEKKENDVPGRRERRALFSSPVRECGILQLASAHRSYAVSQRPPAFFQSKHFAIPHGTFDQPFPPGEKGRQPNACSTPERKIFSMVLVRSTISYQVCIR